MNALPMLIHRQNLPHQYTKWSFSPFWLLEFFFWNDKSCGWQVHIHQVPRIESCHPHDHQSRAAGYGTFTSTMPCMLCMLAEIKHDTSTKCTMDYRSLLLLTFSWQSSKNYIISKIIWTLELPHVASAGSRCCHDAWKSDTCSANNKPPDRWNSSVGETNVWQKSSPG